MKQTVILLHGLFGGLSNWQHVIDHFQESADIHIQPLPVFEEHKEDILEHLVNALHNYIISRELRDVILVGNSLGGHIAILYAYRYPQQVKKLVLTGSSGLYENYTIGSFPKRHDYSYIQRKVTETFYDPAIATKELVDDVFEIVGDNYKCIRIMKTAKATQRSYVTDILPKIRMAVLLIWGINDTITPPKVAEQFNDLLPNSELQYIPNCGHAAMMERPDEFNKILMRFLNI